MNEGLKGLEWHECLVTEFLFWVNYPFKCSQFLKLCRFEPTYTFHENVLLPFNLSL